MATPLPWTPDETLGSLRGLTVGRQHGRQPGGGGRLETPPTRSTASWTSTERQPRFPKGQRRTGNGDRRDGPRHKPHSLGCRGAVGAKPSWSGGAPPCLDCRWPPLPRGAGGPSGCAPPLTPTEDVFPCKDCGIWYRSERNLQAHLLYYCASRQTTGSPAAAADEKPKDTYPNERVCPFPQCRKSCPSASSLEIHMRSHSGEPPPPRRVPLLSSAASGPGARHATGVQCGLPTAP